MDAVALNEEAFKHTEHGMGMESWTNSEIGLAGGMRSGSSPAGYVRLLYLIIDMKKFEETGDQTAAECGKVEVFRSAEGIEGLVNIEVKKHERRGGIGVATIRGLVDTWHDHFSISDIKKVAITFWKKAGCRFYTTGGKELTITEARAHKSTLMGVIHKEGSKTEVTDLVGFSKNKGNIRIVSPSPFQPE